MKKIILILALPIVLLASGCANKVHTYSTATNNTIALQALAKNDKTAKLGAFDDSGKGETKLMCRLASPVGTPEGETFASYIRESLFKEMVVANIYDESTSSVITANLNDIYGSTLLGNAYWEFDITMNSSNGGSYQLTSRYDYESSFSAMSACSEMQRSFVPAVQKLNSAIIEHPSFSSLLN